MRPKLIKNPHPHIQLEEVSDYLEANGFRRADGSDRNSHTTYFYKDDMLVVIKGDNIDFLLRHDEEPEQRTGGYSSIFQLCGISSIETLFDFMLLFHITKAVPLHSFIKGAMKQGVAFRKDDFMDSIMKHFKVTDDHNAIPLNY